MSDMLYQSRRFFQCWWISLVVGVLSIAAGVCCLVTPIDSLVAMTAFFMVVLVVGGIFNIVFAVVNRKQNDYWGWSLARGIMEILFGCWLFMLPLPFVTTALVYVIGFWMLFHSVLGICESCELSNLSIKGWGWLLACNILSLLCSFIFLISPVYGGWFVLLYVGISFILYGVFRIILSFKWKKFNDRIRKEEEEEIIEPEVVE